MSRCGPTIALVCSWLALTPASLTLAQEVELSQPQAKITAAAGARVRAEPRGASREIARLNIGTVVSAVARSADQVELAGKKEHWYRITLPDGRAGWIFGGPLIDYDAARRMDIVRRIVDERLKAEELAFGDTVELYRFVAASAAEATGSADKGEFELMKLRALDRSVALISSEDAGRAPYQDWLKEHEAVVEKRAASEDDTGFSVRPSACWALEQQLRGSAVGDLIAFEAARNEKADCSEEDDACWVAGVLSLDGVKETLKGADGNEEQRTALRKATAEARGVVSKSPSSEKDAVLKLIDALRP